MTDDTKDDVQSPPTLDQYARPLGSISVPLCTATWADVDLSWSEAAGTWADDGGVL
jgi:hypothetical protein